MRFTRFAVGPGLLLLTFAVFSEAREFGYLDFDDHYYVVENAWVREGLSWAGIRWAFTTTFIGNWHPLTWISHMLDSELFMLDPGLHHGMNVLLHATNAVLVYALLLALTGAAARSATVAALFAVHPLHVESVAWISERKDVLCGLFWLLSLLAYARFARRGEGGAWLASLALFALGLLAKPMIVTLPVLLLLLDVWPLGRSSLWRPAQQSAPAVPWRRLIAEKLPFAALAVAGSAAAFHAQLTGGTVRSLAAHPLPQRLLNALVASSDYVANALWPRELAAYYPYPAAFGVLELGRAAFFIGVASAVALRFARTRPYLLVGWLWFLIALVPAIGLVQVGEQAMADRYMYMPLLGLLVVAVWGSAELAARSRAARPALAAAAALAIAGCAVQSRIQVGYWRSDLALFERALEVTRDNWVAHTAVGLSYAKRGDPDRAVQHFSDALRIQPDAPEAWYQLGQAERSRGRADAAIAALEEGVRRDPSHLRARHALGDADWERGELSRALAELAAAVEADPAFERAYLSLRALLFELHTREPDARPPEARLLRPDDARAYLDRQPDRTPDFAP